MAIATSVEKLFDVPVVCTEIVCSTLDAGLDVDISHGGVSGLAPVRVHHTVTTAPTDNSPVLFEWDKSNNDTTNDTIRVKFDTTDGGSLTGAVVSVFVYWGGIGSGGIS
jgi:hypothetical protein